MCRPQDSDCAGAKFTADAPRTTCEQRGFPLRLCMVGREQENYGQHKARAHEDTDQCQPVRVRMQKRAPANLRRRSATVLHFFARSHGTVTSAARLCSAVLSPCGWQFWMLTSRHLTEDGHHGFAMDTAVRSPRGATTFSQARPGCSRLALCHDPQHHQCRSLSPAHGRLLHCPTKPRSKCAASDIRER
jgi:hypothetical protein